MKPDATTVREAAVQIILSNVGPLLDSAEELVKTTKEAHTLITADLAKLGALVTNVEKLLEHAAENSTVLVQELKAARGGVVATPAGVAAPVAVSAQVAPKVPKALPPRRPDAGFPWLRMMAMCLLTAMMAVTGVTVLQLKTVEQARLGRAVVRALPQLDAVSRAKLEAAIQKTKG